MSPSDYDRLKKYIRNQHDVFGVNTWVPFYLLNGVPELTTRSIVIVIEDLASNPKDFIESLKRYIDEKHLPQIEINNDYTKFKILTKAKHIK